jgi:hypothetical protein
MEPSESVEELSAEYLPQNPNREQESLLGSDPLRAIGGESTCRNDAVDMRMEQQVLSPCVEDGKHADVGAEPFGVACNFDQGLGCRCEQQIVEDTRTGQGEDVEFVRDGKHGMEVAGGQQFLLAVFDPALAGSGLALRAVPVTAGVERDAVLEAASGAHVEVTAERSGAAGQHGAIRLQLLIADRRVVALEVPVALSTEDVGQLQCGPAHDLGGRRREWSARSTLVRSRSSIGLATCCRCFADKCRYLAVVSRSSCPSSIWMVRRSVPASSRCVAQL